MSCTVQNVSPFIRLAAPYPAIQTISKFPNPEFGDSERKTSTVNFIRTLDGSLYSYVKKKGGRRRLQFRFRLTRFKALELREFIIAYFASTIELTDVEGVRWIGNFVTNPFEFETTGRYGGNPTIAGAEEQTLTLDFEGLKQP